MEDATPDKKKMILTYEQLMQWRDICEFLDKRRYKFLDYDYCNFSLLLPHSRPHRFELWSEYTIQFCAFGCHPYGYYSGSRVYQKIKGWRLVVDWEDKIDFLEKVVLLNKNPEDLEMPWKAKIWQKIFERREREEREREKRDAWFEQQKSEHERIAALIECPLKFSCKAMSGVDLASDCPNVKTCKNMYYQI